MLAEFFTWWRQQLLELVPERVRRAVGADDGNALVVELNTSGPLTLWRRRRGVETKLAQPRLDEPGLTAVRALFAGRAADEPIMLRLPPTAVLERSVALPLAAERDVERVLAYDMERLTPFTAEEVFWAAALEARDKARGRLRMRLTLVPRANIQELIDTLTSCGGAPTMLEAQTARGPRTIRVAHEAAATARLALLSPRTAAMVFGGLAVLAIISPFARQSLDFAEAQNRLDGLAPRMQMVDQLRRRIAGAGAGGDVVEAEGHRLGDPLAALAAVTEILPDDSYLTEFEMRERKITLSGLSDSAPRLISRLSADERIGNPAFTAPVTKQEPSKKDVFSIRADLAP